MAQTETRRQAKDALFDAFASMARAFSSGRRVEIIDVLAQGECTVEQLAGEIGQSVANTSHHLRTMARAGLVSRRRAGTHVHYRLASDDVLQLWWAIRQVAADRLDAVDRLARAYLGDRSESRSITRNELRDALDRGDVVLVDVRPASEYTAGHLPGAICIPPHRFDLLDELPTDRDIVAYGRGPYCVYAEDAVRQLRQSGRRAVRLDEGLPEWRHAGGAVEA